jgi:hypothetical protein
MSIKRPGVRVASLLALLLTMALPTGLAMAQEPVLISAAGASGTAIISDSVSLGDTITIAMKDVPAQSADTALEGWLITDDGSAKLSTGIMAVGADGTIAHVFVSADGENLIASYNKFVVTVEPAPDTDPEPSGVIAFSHRIPLAGAAHVRHLLTSWPPGTDSGILANLRTQLQMAIDHVELAINAATLEEVQLHTHHVLNIIEGVDGANFDASFGNPGDGLGVLLHAEDSKHATFAAQEAGEVIFTTNAALVEASGGNAADRAIAARDIALVSLGESSLFAAKLNLTPVLGLLTTALHGVDADADGTIASGSNEGGADQAYVSAQLMATYTMAEGGLEPVGPELGIGLSKTGDESVAIMAMMALAGALVLIIGGGAMVLRTRRIKNDR